MTPETYEFIIGLLVEELNLPVGTYVIDKPLLLNGKLIGEERRTA